MTDARKSPGQLAYEADMEPGGLGAPVAWTECSEAERAYWERIGAAVVEGVREPARTYIVHLWFAELDGLDVPRMQRDLSRHRDPRGRPIVNGELDLTPTELVWLSERYDVMITPTGDEGDTLLALSPRGRKFGQR